jgi:hypothetical protein
MLNTTKKLSYYIWLTDNDIALLDQEEMLGRPLRKSELKHLYNVYLMGLQQ